MTNLDFQAIRTRWVTEAAESDLGLWWLADDLREILPDDPTEDEVRIATLEALRPLLESGKLRAVTLREGGTFDAWTGEVDRQLASIAREWKAIGKPDIGDIVWFMGERS